MVCLSLTKAVTVDRLHVIRQNSPAKCSSADWTIQMYNTNITTRKYSACKIMSNVAVKINSAETHKQTTYLFRLLLPLLHGWHSLSLYTASATYWTTMVLTNCGRFFFSNFSCQEFDRLLCNCSVKGCRENIMLFTSFDAVILPLEKLVKWSREIAMSVPEWWWRYIIRVDSSEELHSGLTQNLMNIIKLLCENF